MRKESKKRTNFKMAENESKIFLMMLKMMRRLFLRITLAESIQLPLLLPYLLAASVSMPMRAEENLLSALEAHSDPDTGTNSNPAGRSSFENAYAQEKDENTLATAGKPAPWRRSRILPHPHGAVQWSVRARERSSAANAPATL
eukprot:IDg21664t1